MRSVEDVPYVGLLCRYIYVGVIVGWCLSCCYSLQSPYEAPRLASKWRPCSESNMQYSPWRYTMDGVVEWQQLGCCCWARGYHIRRSSGTDGESRRAIQWIERPHTQASYTVNEQCPCRTGTSFEDSVTTASHPYHVAQDLRPPLLHLVGIQELRIQVERRVVGRLYLQTNAIWG